MLKGILEAVLILFQGARKNDTIKTSVAITLIVAALWVGVKAAYYKEQIEKIPCIEQKVSEHEKVITAIPMIANDVQDIKRILMRQDRRDRR